MRDRDSLEKKGLALFAAFMIGWALIRAASPRPAPVPDEPFPSAARSPRRYVPAAAAPPADAGPAMTPPEPAFKRDAVSLLSGGGEGGGGPPALMDQNASAPAGPVPRPSLSGGTGWQLSSGSGGARPTASASFGGAAPASVRAPRPVASAPPAAGPPASVTGASSPRAPLTARTPVAAAAPVPAPSLAATGEAPEHAKEAALAGRPAPGRPSPDAFHSASSAMAGGGGGGGGGGGSDDAGGGGDAGGLAAGGPTAQKPKESAGPPKGGDSGGPPSAGGEARSGDGSGGGGGAGASPDASQEAAVVNPILGAPQPQNPAPSAAFALDPNAPLSVPTFVSKTKTGSAVSFTSKMAIDADGAGGWWLKDKTDRRHGNDGSKTSARYANGDSLNPGKIPFIVVPLDFDRAHPGVQLGDYAAVTYGGKTVFAIVGDKGPKGVVGEGSISLARSLRIPADPNGGGVRQGVTYVILPGTKTAALPRTAAEVQSQGQAAFQKAGIPPV